MDFKHMWNAGQCIQLLRDLLTCIELHTKDSFTRAQMQPKGPLAYLSPGIYVTARIVYTAHHASIVVRYNKDDYGHHGSVKRRWEIALYHGGWEIASPDGRSGACTDSPEDLCGTDGVEDVLVPTVLHICDQLVHMAGRVSGVLNATGWLSIECGWRHGEVSTWDFGLADLAKVLWTRHWRFRVPDMPEALARAGASNEVAVALDMIEQTIEFGGRAADSLKGTSADSKEHHDAALLVEGDSDVIITAKRHSLDAGVHGGWGFAVRGGKGPMSAAERSIAFALRELWGHRWDGSRDHSISHR